MQGSIDPTLVLYPGLEVTQQQFVHIVATINILVWIGLNFRIFSRSFMCLAQVQTLPNQTYRDFLPCNRSRFRLRNTTVLTSSVGQGQSSHFGSCVGPHGVTWADRYDGCAFDDGLLQRTPITAKQSLECESTGSTFAPAGSTWNSSGRARYTDAAHWSGILVSRFLPVTSQKVSTGNSYGLLFGAATVCRRKGKGLPSVNQSQTVEALMKGDYKNWMVALHHKYDNQTLGRFFINYHKGWCFLMLRKTSECLELSSV